MKKVYEGKTKDVFALENGNYLLIFKDDMTGENGVFDPGANQVGLTIEGIGKGNLQVSALFFQMLKEEGVASHFVKADFDQVSMEVKAGKAFGQGLEVICRYRAVGSFLRRYGAYVNEGHKLDAYVEATIKDDHRGDPLITLEGLEALGIMDAAQFAQIKAETQKITAIISQHLQTKGLELYDIKLEFGLDNEGKLMLMDELSSGNMRVYRQGQVLQPEELTEILLAK
jgi:phosphoribosylaminoimidazole-succinocarboxamide synthase